MVYSCGFLYSNNCSLDLQTDSWDEYLRARQLNKVFQGTGNENLALSVESQALGEISSHPTDSISSLEGDGLQVSVISHSTAAEVSFSMQTTLCPAAGRGLKVTKFPAVIVLPIRKQPKPLLRLFANRLALNTMLSY